MTHSRWCLFTMLAITPFASTLAQAGPDSVAARLRDEFAPFLRDLVDQDRFSGVVMVAHGGTPIFSAAYGLADKERNVANTVATRFNLGSMNKMFTAVAIAQLVASGKVSVDSTIGRYLPDYPNRDVALHVTLRQLLTHTSGLGDYFQNGYPENQERITRASDLFKYFETDSLAFPPGARMGYSNAGYAVLGAIIERVSGETYFDYVQRHIFGPAGMTSSGFDAAGAATGYTRRSAGQALAGPDTGQRKPNTGLIEARGGPAGGGYSNARDLVAFGRALWTDQLAPRAIMAEFTTGKVTMGPSMKYAFGFGDARLGTVRNVGHNGGAKGVNAEFVSYPDLGYDVVVLTNYDPPIATTVIGRIRQIIAR